MLYAERGRENKKGEKCYTCACKNIILFNCRKTLRNRKLLTNGTANSDERRKSRRHSTGTTALSHAVSLTLARHHSETSSPEDYRIKQCKYGYDFFHLCTFSF